MIFVRAPPNPLPMKLITTLLLSASAFGASAQFNLATDLRSFYPMNGDWWNAQGELDDHALFANAAFGNDAQTVANNAGLFSGSARVNINRGVIGAQIGTFTVEFWFRSTATTSQVLYWEGALNQQSVWIRLEPANSRIQASLGTSTQFLQAPAAGTFNNGVWHHYALTAANNTIATVYVDGVLNATYTGAWPTTATTNFTRLGCKEDLTQYLNGSLDDVRVWGRALTAAEVQNAYQAPHITLGALGSTSLCAGTSTALVFTVGSGSFQAGNTYYAQLSDASGSFEFPQVIGSLASTGSGSITLTVPATVATGSNYRVRVLATHMPVASQNTLPITITNPDAATGYDITSDLRIHYPFDGAVTDASGFGINGNAAGNLLPDTGHTGSPNTAMLFNGSNTSVAIGDRWPIKRLGGTTLPLSVSLWVHQATTPSTFGYLFSLYNGNLGNGLFLGTTSTGKVRFRINSSQSIEADITNNTWTLVTAVYDGAAIRLYINGALAASTNTTGTIQNLLPAEIGREASQGIAHFNGAMDDFRFYGRALTAQEALRLYRDGSLAGSNAPLCDGGTLQFDGPTYAGLIYDWSGPGAFSSSDEDPTIAQFTPFTQAGDYQLVLSLNGCTGDPTTIAVESTVSAPQVTSETVCAGEPYNLLATGAAPGQGYNWYADAAGTIVLATNTDNYGGTGTASTTVYVNLVQGGICSSAPAQGTITVNALPVVGYTETAGTLCLSDPSTALSPGTPAGGTYSGAGVNGINIDPALAGLGTHEIAYTYVDANGCANSDTSTVFVEVCTLIAQADASSISVQPNPFTDHFTLSGSTVGAWIRVCDMTGREVARARATSGRASFDSSSWPSGVYCVQLSAEHPVAVRLVKQ